MGEFCALLTKVKVAVTEPAVVGVNVTVNGRLWPAGIVTGKVSPLTVNCALFVLAEVTVTLAPEAVSVPEPEPVVPTTTLPKASVVGKTLNWPTAVVPVPDSAIVSDGLEALDVTVTVPVAAPAEVGLNFTLKLVLCPAPRVTGVVTPLKVNAVPVIETCEIVTLVPPEFVTVSDSDELLPSVTLPKLRLVGLEVRSPGETPVPDKPILNDGLEALDVTVTLPLALPAAAGVNTT